ncbi:MAG: phosphotransferase family protein [Ilumatobacteraceae bacterium]
MLPDELVTWVGAQIEATVESVQRVVAGGRRLGYVITSGGASPQQYYLAVEPGDATAGDRPSGLRKEAEVFRRLAAGGVPVPTVVAVHPTVDAMLMHLVRGTAAYSQLTDPAERELVARDFIRSLAAAHRVDPHVDPVPGLDPTGSARDHLLAFIDQWEAEYRGGRHGADVLMEHALAWLKANAPAPVRPLAFVQGDTGPGNFMFDEGKVTAIVDWELAHLGDPFEDLGWLSMRAAQDPFTDLAARFEDYSADSGLELDLPAIRYYRVLAEWTIALIGHLKSRDDLGDAERGNAFVFEQLHRRLLVEALSDADGTQLDPAPVLHPADTPQTWMYDMALDQLRVSVLGQLSDPLAIRRAKGVARTVKLLREIDRAGREAEALEREALSALLGRPVDDLSRARLLAAQKVGAADLDPVAVRAYVWFRISLDNQLHGPAMGRLRDRHLDPLPDPLPDPAGAPR